MLPSGAIEAYCRSVGGMGIPVLKDYYVASMLDQHRNWFSCSTLKPWCQLEFSWMHSKSPQSLLMVTELFSTGKNVEHSNIQATLQAWSYLRKTSEDILTCSNIPIPLESLKWTIPDIALDQWLSKGV